MSHSETHPSYAQTNLQLFNQMRAAGYGDADLKTVRTAYDLATRLFTAKFRGSGKPLLSHLVGTASVLCAVNAPAPLLAAAVLHAAYIFGEFGDGRRGMTPAKRQIVRQAVGEEIEDLVARYEELEWTDPTIKALHARVDPLTRPERDVLLIRLANELEDHLDLGVLYCGNAQYRRDLIGSALNLCIDLATRIGEPGLAAELRRVFDEVLSADVPETLRHPNDYTYLLPPTSYMVKPGVTIRQVFDRHPKLGLLLHPTRLLALVLALGH